MTHGITKETGRHIQERTKGNRSETHIHTDTERERERERERDVQQQSCPNRSYSLAHLLLDRVDARDFASQKYPVFRDPVHERDFASQKRVQKDYPVFRDRVHEGDPKIEAGKNLRFAPLDRVSVHRRSTYREVRSSRPRAPEVLTKGKKTASATEGRQDKPLCSTG